MPIETRDRRENETDWFRIIAISLVGAGALAVAAWLLEEQIVVAGLLPDVAARWGRLKAKAAAVGIEIRAISTIRDADQQAKKILQGRTAGKLTWHFLGRAVDFQVKDPATGAWDSKAKRLDLYLRVARLAEGEGFRQLGFNADDSVRTLKTSDGRPFTDPYHLEVRGPYPTLTAAIKAERPDLLLA